jgi:predicted DCC family thiol-disulfide oxidoreductase YuxK
VALPGPPDWDCLDFPWSLATTFRLMPMRLGDALYSSIARRRHHIFGKRETFYRPEKNRYEERLLA